MPDNLTIRKVEDSDRDWVLKIARGWGADFIISRCEKLYPHRLDGFIAENKLCPESSDRPVGLLTYKIRGEEVEIVTLDAFKQFQGIGSALIEELRLSLPSDCKRIWLLTTNDNLDAIRFYQRRGFVISAIYCDAIEESRKLKQSIPLIGQHGIPIRDEIEFEMLLDGKSLHD